MVTARTVGLFFVFVLLTACAGPQLPPPSAPILLRPEPVAVVAEPSAAPATAPTTSSKRPPPPRTQAQPAKSPAHVAAPVPAVAQAPSVAPAAPPAPPPLDLTSLAARLKDTHAIGFFTKVALKNQVDDLVSQFRAFYEGRSQTTLAALRRPYDQLLLKVLALLQDSDPPLASAIVASREAIWGVLADRTSFAAIQS